MLRRSVFRGTKLDENMKVYSVGDMTFQPRMQNRVEGFSVVGDINRRQWNGIVADVRDVERAPHAAGYHVGQDPRNSLLRDKRGPAQSSSRVPPGGQDARQ